MVEVSTFQGVRVVLEDAYDRKRKKKRGLIDRMDKRCEICINKFCYSMGIALFIFSLFTSLFLAHLYSQYFKTKYYIHQKLFTSKLHFIGVTLIDRKITGLEFSRGPPCGQSNRCKATPKTQNIILTPRIVWTLFSRTLLFTARLALHCLPHHLFRRPCCHNTPRHET